MRNLTLALLLSFLLTGYCDTSPSPARDHHHEEFDMDLLTLARLIARKETSVNNPIAAIGLDKAHYENGEFFGLSWEDPRFLFVTILNGRGFTGDKVFSLDVWIRSELTLMTSDISLTHEFKQLHLLLRGKYGLLYEYDDATLPFKAWIELFAFRSPMTSDEFRIDQISVSRSERR